MQRWHAFLQLILARIREFYREPEAIFWVYGFPLMLAGGLGIAFKGTEPKPPTVDVADEPNAEHAKKLATQLERHKMQVHIHSAQECRARLVRGLTDIMLVVDGSSSTANGRPHFQCEYDPVRPEGQLAMKWVEAALLRDASTTGPVVEAIPVTEPGTRYIDFLLPGLIGMNIMGGGLFGVGFVIVDMRVKKLFKRLLATPMHRGDYLLSLLTARMLFLAPEMLSLLLMAWFLGVPVRGSPLGLAAVIVMGALAFAGIGLLIGSRTDKTETASGLIQLVMLPMYLLSGIFFSSKRFPEAAQPFIQALPLTQVIDGLRSVMLEGAGLTGIAWPLGILALWAVGSFALALRWFRWR